MLSELQKQSQMESRANDFPVRSVGGVRGKRRDERGRLRVSPGEISHPGAAVIKSRDEWLADANADEGRRVDSISANCRLPSIGARAGDDAVRTTTAGHIDAMLRGAEVTRMMNQNSRNSVQVLKDENG
jgi:hypothetical protein